MYNDNYLESHFLRNISATFFLLIAIICSCNFSDEGKGINHPAKVGSLIAHADSLLETLALTSNKSRQFLDSAYRSFRPGPLDLSKKHKHFAWSYLRAKDSKKAYRYADSMIRVLEPYEQHYKYEYADALFYKGRLLEWEHKDEEAFEWYYKARKYATNNVDSCRMVMFTYPLATTNYSYSNPKVAAYYCKLTVNEAKYCNDGPDIVNRLLFPSAALQYLGSYYRNLGQLDSAVFYLKQSTELINRLGPKFSNKTNSIAWTTIKNHALLGSVYLRQKKYKEAEYHLKESMKLVDRSMGEHSYIFGSYANLSEIYIRTSRIEEARKIIKQIEKDNEWASYFKKEYYDLKRSYFDKKGQLDSAYFYLQKLKTNTDSAQNAKILAKETNMEQAFQKEEQGYKLLLLQTKSKEERNYTRIAIVFSIVLILIVILIIYNAKKIRKLNTEMRQALAILEQSQQENSLMMKIVAHDLRGSMTAAISVTSTLLRSNELNATNKKIIELLEVSSTNSMEMIEDLLMMNIVDKDMIREPVEIHTLLQHCIGLLKYKAGEKKQKITLTLIPVVLMANSEKLWRAFSNILINAIKFSREHTVIEVGMEQMIDRVLISIRDEGIGIPKAIQEKIFSISPEKNRAGTIGEKSFGLGLFISKQIIEAHGGQIWCESSSHGGTVFFIELQY